MHWTTPLIKLESRHLAGCRVRLKMECWQEPGSFKIRGIGHLMQRAADGGARRFVASSGGNAGMAAAWAGRRLGLPVDVVVPKTTPLPARRRLELLGARLTVHGGVWDEADERARELAAQGACYVPPFDHPDLWAGHATLIEECARQGERPDAVVLSVGGGGLLCGVLQGMHAVGWEDVPVLAVETRGAAALRAAMEAGGPVRLDRIDSVAKSLGALAVAEEAWRWTTRHPVESLLVTDAQAVAACLRFLSDHRTVVEPACGAALAVAYETRNRYRDILLVVCGGATTSDQDLRDWARNLELRDSDPLDSETDEDSRR